MQEQILTELIEWKTTTYTCDVEGCEFTTEDKSNSDNHYGRKHSVAAVGYAGEETFYRFDTKENFDAYVKANYIQDRHFSWDEPGWYRTFSKEDRAGCGCCYDSYPYIGPALDIAYEWQRKIKAKQERLDELLTFLGEEI